MANDKAQGIGWSVAIAVVGVMGGILTFIGVDMRSSIREVNVNVSKINRDLSDIRVELSVIKSNSFTRADGLEVWKAVSRVTNVVENLPLRETQKQIDTNTTRINSHITSPGLHSGDRDKLIGR